MNTEQHTGPWRASRLALAAASLVLCSAAAGQFRISGQASSAFLKSNDGPSQYAVDGGRATWAWRLDLFADAVIAENIYFLSNVRLEQDQALRIDLFALKLTDVASTGVNVEMGEIELPFGDLGERRFPKDNPFYNLPLIREHRTTLRSSNAEFWFDDARYTRRGDGYRILDGGLYDLGAKVYGGIGMFDYWVAVVNGMVSATSTYSATSGLNANSGLGTIIRAAATPMTGLTFGGSYATGTFLGEDPAYGTGTGYLPADVSQNAFEGDVDFSIGHLALYGEAVYSRWGFAGEIGEDLTATGYSLEARYTVMPRLTLAARAGGLSFNSVTVDALTTGYGVEHRVGPWDQDVVRVEGAVGYRLDRAALVKVVYQWNSTLDAVTDPVDNVILFQAVVSF